MKKLLFLLCIVPFTVRAGWMNTDWQYRKKHYIDSVANAGQNYQIRIVADYDTGTIIRGADIPVHRQDLLRYDEHGDSIILEHTLTMATGTKVVYLKTPTSCSGEGWIGPGGGSFLKDGSNYYISCRVRCGNTERGYGWQIWSSTDLETWDTVWTARKADVINDPYAIYSLEANCLRKFGSTYYFYFCAADASTWYIYYIRAASIAALQDSLLDADHWHGMFEGTIYQKDPTVMMIGDYYYCLHQHLWGSDVESRLVRSSTPTFASYDSISMPAHSYWEDYNPSQCIRGTIFYDEDASCYIFWGTGRHTGVPAEGYLSRWFWSISYDLVNWRVVDTMTVADSTDKITARYIDHYAINDDQSILIMEWGETPSQDTIGIYLWDFTDDPTGSGVNRPRAGGGDRVYMDALCQNDFDDIRFANGGGETQLDHYRETYATGDTAVFWVEVEANLSTDSQYIYIYYNNDGISSASSGANTFIAFDDFEDKTHGDSLYESPWTEVVPANIRTRIDTVDQSTSNYKTAVFDSIDAAVCASERSFSQIAGDSTAIQFLAKPTTTNQRIDFGPRNLTGTSNSYYGPHLSFMNTGYVQYHNGSAFQNICQYTANTWYNIILADLNFSSHTFDFIMNDSLYADDIVFRNATVSNATIMHIFRGTSASAGRIYFDLFRVRKWVHTQPEQRSWTIKELVQPETKIIIVN